MNQIGVTNVATVPALAISSLSVATIQGSEPTPVNDAPCNSSAILTIVKEVMSAAVIDSTDQTVGSCGCQTLVAFAGMPNTTNRLFVEITNLDSLSEALAYYERHRDVLAQLGDPETRLPANKIGQQAFRTPVSLFWRRNLMCIRVFVAASTVFHIPLNEVATLILNVSKTLDAYLGAYAVKPGHESRPAPILKHGQDKLVVDASSKVEVHLHDAENISDICIAEIEDENIIQQASIGPREDGKLGFIEFIALQPGETKVVICVAHKINLSISTVNITIKVKEASKSTYVY